MIHCNVGLLFNKAACLRISYASLQLQIAACEKRQNDGFDHVKSLEWLNKLHIAYCGRTEYS